MYPRRRRVPARRAYTCAQPAPQTPRETFTCVSDIDSVRRARSARGVQVPARTIAKQGARHGCRDSSATASGPRCTYLATVKPSCCGDSSAGNVRTSSRDAPLVVLAVSASAVRSDSTAARVAACSLQANLTSSASPRARIASPGLSVRACAGRQQKARETVERPAVMSESLLDLADPAPNPRARPASRGPGPVSTLDWTRAGRLSRGSSVSRSHRR
jgi:hypothetical protein